MTGEQWMAERLKEFTLLASAGPEMTPEKAAALLDLVGGDRALLDQVMTTKDARPQQDLFDSVSDYLVQRKGPQWL